MKKSLLIHIVLMAVAVAAGSSLATYLSTQQMEITKEKKDLANSPIAGFHKFAADVEWMFFINYLGSLKTVDNTNLNEVTKRLQRIISYDPNFEKVYQDGVLSMSVADPEMTVKILKQACDNDYLKTNWQIPFYAGFVMTHHAKAPDHAEAANFFQMALQRAGDKPESYIVNSYIRAKAKTLNIKEEKLAILKVLYDEWKKERDTKKDVSATNGETGAAISGSAIPDLLGRLLKTAQEAKNSDDPKPSENLLKFIDQIRSEVLTGQHLCGNCLTPSSPGEKFCSSCGNKIELWGICPKCGAVLKNGAGFCGACGQSVKAPQAAEKK